MFIITSNSTTAEKKAGLLIVQNAILALRGVGNIGLATRTTDEQIAELKIYEKQLTDYLKKEG